MRFTPPLRTNWFDSDTVVFGRQCSRSVAEVVRFTGRAIAVVRSGRLGPAALLAQVLPGNKAVLFTVANGSALTDARIWIVTTSSGEKRPLFDANAYAPRYVASKHIVFGNGPNCELMAVRFDLSKLEIVGSPSA